VPRHGTGLRHLLLQLGGEVQGTGQRRGFKNVDAVQSGFFADAGGHVVRALGHQHRRAIAGGIVFERHGKVLGVGDDHVGILDALHHAGVGHLALTAADLGFDLRTAFHLLELVLDLLLGHAHALGELVLLVGHIDHRDQHQAHGRPKGRLAQHGACGLHGWLQPHAAQTDQRLFVVHDRSPEHQRHQGKFEQGLGQLDQGVWAKHALEPVHGVELGCGGRGGLERKQVAAGHARRKHGRDHGEQQNRQDQQKGFAQLATEDGWQHLGAIQCLAIEDKAVGKQGAEVADHPASQHEQDQQRADHDRGGGQLHRAGDLTVFAGLAQAPRRGGFCAVLFVRHGSLQ